MFDLLSRFEFAWKHAWLVLTEIIVAENRPFVRNKFVTLARESSGDD